MTLADHSRSGFVSFCIKAALAALMGLAVLGAPASQASTVAPKLKVGGSYELLVDTNASSGPGSLPWSMEYASRERGKAKIRFANGVRGEIVVPKPLLVTGDVTVQGPGAGALRISGAGQTRILEVAADGELDLSGLTLANGKDTGASAEEPYRSGGSGMGGAILNRGVAWLSNAVLTANAAVGGRSAKWHGGAGYGGAIMNFGKMTIDGSLLSGNSARGNGDHGLATFDELTGGDAAGGAIRNEGTLSISDSELRDNSATGADGSQYIIALAGTVGTDAGSGMGGAVFSGAKADTLRIFRSTLAGNSSSGGFAGQGSIRSGRSGDAGGGAVYALGSLMLGQSTVAGNSVKATNPSGVGPAVAYGAGLALVGPSHLLRSSTIALNGSGGDISAKGPTAQAMNTIIGTCVGSPLTSLGYNIDGGSSCGFATATDRSKTDAMLGGLSWQGGPTRTIPLLPGSPAVDQGLGAEPSDQRGLKRPVSFDAIPKPAGGNGVDIGAFELQRLSPLGLTPEVLSFPDQRLETTSKPLELALANLGSEALRIGAVTIEGSDVDDYAISSQTCASSTITVGDSCRVRVRFTPSEGGGRTAKLRLATSAPGLGTVFVPLTGNGIEPAPGSARKAKSKK